MLGVQPPRWDLAPAALEPREGVRMFLEVPGDISPVLAVEVRAQDVTRAIGPRATSKGSGAPLFRPLKSYIVYLRVVLRLNDRKPFPVYCRFRPVHEMTAFRHRPHGELKSALHARDMSPDPHMV